MKKIDRLILRSFIGPLVLTFSISVFVLLMQFVWKYIDDLVGKGLEFSVIAELLMYASATFVPMALPIAVLFASIMTMGNFGEKYELVAMKAGGISVSRVMMPMTLVVLLLTGMAFYFANNVMPSAMLKYRMTLYDVTRKKPAVNIRAGEYYKDIEGYVIRVGSKDPDGRTLHDVIIYDHSKGMSETTVIVAQRGVMQSSPDNRYLRFTLNDGYSYTESTTGENYNRRPLTSIGFTEQTITFDISSFAFNRSGEDLFKGSYQMMNVAQLDTTVHQLEESFAERRQQCRNDLTVSMHAWNQYKAGKEVVEKAEDTERPEIKPEERRRRIYNYAINSATSGAKDAKMNAELQQADREYINRHYIEWQRKYTLSVACLLLFLIGAPFGSIVRKGGLGLPLVASVLFFVIYYIIGMISEKAVREGVIGPIGMWISTFAMLPIGIILTFQATTDSSLFDAASWKRFFQRLLGLKQRT
ncbi:MAG: LptF/LptG family permease [Bacteroidales bacterium]|nr:LptF/LptG family permease [Bacteroidales bacterium]MBR5093228.1 LptF/LptG family permease [Bacteroidales bacterium]